MKNKIEDLRNHLFATIEALLDEDHPMDIDRAKAVAEVGKVLIDSAKVEVDFIKQTGANGTGFIPEGYDVKPKPEKPKEIGGHS